MTRATGQTRTGRSTPPAVGAIGSPDSSGRTLAILSYSSGQFDARSMRIARSAVARGWEVSIYCRLEPGLPDVELHEGYRVIRVPADPRLAVPGLRRWARRRARPSPASGEASTAGAAPPARGLLQRIARPFPMLRRWRRQLLNFPLRPMGWAVAVDDVVAPASVWHGMWAGSLPALGRQRRRLGGATVYDSRDVFMLSREWVRLERPVRPLLAAVERHHARRVDAVLTVNEPFADLLVRQLGVRRPRVVLNCPEAWTPPNPPPNLIREALGLPAETAVVLYQGQLISERGIEEAMDAILEVPDAVLVLLGYGPWQDRYRARSSEAPYLDRVRLLPAVAPADLLVWTASADATVVAIQPTTPNHRYTTPQKLFESIAAGVPVVAADLPGMRRIVEETGAGVLCDPTSPSAIAAGIRTLLSTSPSGRAARRARLLAVARERYSWQAQAEELFGLYEEILER